MTGKKKEVWNFARAMLFLVAAAVVGGMVWAGFHNKEKLDERGGVGNLCYPNDSCDNSLTCFAIRARHQCEMSIQPVFTDGLPSCFIVRNMLGEERQHCEPTQDECKMAFARVAGIGDIVKGCSR